MFESPGSILAFMCATFPFVLMWMYDYICDIFLPYVPDAEYFALKLMWIITKAYTYVERRGYKAIGFVSKMLRQTSTKNLLLIKDGNVIQKIQFEKMNEITNEEDYDMVLLEYNVEHPELTDKYKTHIIRWTLVEEVIDYFDVCDTSFMGINVSIKNKDDSKVVKSESVIFGSENYYVVGNILFDRFFIQYWMMKYYQFEMSSNHTYEVSFFDSNITPHTVNEPEYIQFTKNGFDIIRPNILVSEENMEATDETIESSYANKCDENEWELEPEDKVNVKNSRQPVPEMPQGNFLHSYFKGSTNWSQMFKSKNE